MYTLYNVYIHNYIKMLKHVIIIMLLHVLTNMLLKHVNTCYYMYILTLTCCNMLLHVYININKHVNTHNRNILLKNT